ncbi:MAG: energy transducer TonB [Proteobacteria bacterium]|nr:energy transducer TonB [Pseudomonadota bacterium]MCH8321486.1 energy transducer TonB [Pseudomonadota bacterium]
MQRIARYGSSAIVATAVTLGLFFLMLALIESGDKKIPDDQTRRNIEMIKVDREETVQRKERIERPPEQIKPPELEVPKVTTTGPSKTVFNFDLPTGPQTILGSGINAGDGDYLPIVKVNPIYPPRAAGRGIEGYVVVEYIVNRDGTVRDVVIIDAEPPGVFNRAAVSAAQKYIYKPRVIDGTPVEVHGVRTRITFELED